jgi:hypothetical protein
VNWFVAVLKISAAAGRLVPSKPPEMRTSPEFNATALAPNRAALMLFDVAVNVPVVGLYISAVAVAVQDVLEVQFSPPAINTDPFVSSVIVWALRGCVMVPALLNVPELGL